MKQIFICFLLISPMLLLGQNNDQAIRFTVKEAPEWTNLFKRDSGWFGGDGIYAIPLNGKENMEPTDTTNNIFLFSDTLFGIIKDSVLQPGLKMVNNSMAVLKGHDPVISRIKFRVRMDSMGNPGSLFVPQTPQSNKDDYLWLADGFVNPANKSLYVFAYRVVNIPEIKEFGFKVTGSIMIKIPTGSEYPYANQKQTDIPLIPENSKCGGGIFGSAIFVNTREANAPNPDGYIYIYAVTGAKGSLVVARVLPQFIDEFGKWTFWDGKDWSDQMENMATLVDGVSNEMSISPIPGDKYALVFQMAALSRKTAMRISNSPTGPFSDPYVLHDCSADLKSPNFYAYNAKAHPSLSKPGELIISYNVNSFDFFTEIKHYPQMYRPRFIKVVFE